MENENNNNKNDITNTGDVDSINDGNEGLYYNDNSFNNQGIDAVESYQMPNQSGVNSLVNFGRGVAAGVKGGFDAAMGKNPALGVKGAKDSNKLPGSSSDNKKNDSAKNGKNDGNPMKGQKDSKGQNNNKLPGTADRPDKKQNTGNNKKGPNDEKKSGISDKFGNKNNKNGIMSRFNPMKKRAASGAGGGAKAGRSIAEGAKKVFMALPITAKIVVVSTLVVLPIILLGFLIIVSLLGGTTATVAATMCSESSSGSSYNGADYQGSASVTEFMCKMQKPTFGYSLTSKYGYRICPYHGREIHSGVDLAASSGTPIYAVQAGTVLSAGWNGSYGNSITINHGNVIHTLYAHLSEIKVKRGDKVGKGQLIAEMGSTGNSTGPHLHFEIRLASNSKHQNSNPYFAKYNNFKKNCGSSWDGEPTGDSVNEKNDTNSDYVSSESDEDYSNRQCCVSSSSSSSSSSSGEYCPDGITVTGNYAGTYDLDEYIARVVTAENGGANDEALKALAIAARTYALNRTNNCKKTIVNSTDAQVMAETASDRVAKVISEVNGSVMLYKGEVFSAQYSSFWGSCNGSTCTGKFKKAPTETWGQTYTMPRSYYTLTGHSYGMSQNGSNYMASQGKKYDEILKFFYADGIKITEATGNTCTVGGNSFDGKIYKYYQTDYKQKFCGTQTISHSGCGPTSMAVVVSSLLNEAHDPVELSKFACDNGYCSKEEGNGCYSSLFKAASKEYGLNYSTISPSKSDEVLAKLNGGKTMFIALMKPDLTPFALTTGHFIVIYGTDGEGNVSVWDPYESHKVNDKTWNFKKYFNSDTVTGMYMFSKK